MEHKQIKHASLRENIGVDYNTFTMTEICES